MDHLIFARTLALITAFVFCIQHHTVHLTIGAHLIHYQQEMEA